MRPNTIIEVCGKLYLATRVGHRIVKTMYIGRA